MVFYDLQNTVQLCPLACLHQGSPVGIDLIDIKEVLDPLRGPFISFVSEGKPTTYPTCLLQKQTAYTYLSL